MIITRHTLAAAAVVVIGAGSLMAVASVASVPDRAHVFHGCVNKQSGVLTVIDTARTSRCPQGSKAISWNQKGVAGPRGARGARGPAGLSGAFAAASDGIGDLQTGPVPPQPVVTTTHRLPVGSYVWTGTAEFSSTNATGEVPGVNCDLDYQAGDVGAHRPATGSVDGGASLTGNGSITLAKSRTVSFDCGSGAMNANVHSFFATLTLVPVSSVAD